jgi:hypothetical protein
MKDSPPPTKNRNVKCIWTIEILELEQVGMLAQALKIFWGKVGTPCKKLADIHPRQGLGQRNHF